MPHAKAQRREDDAEADPFRDWYWFYVAVIVLVLLLLIGYGFLHFVVGFYIDPDDAIGMTQDQVRQEYGEPDWVVPGEAEGDQNTDWVYHHGLRSSAVEFRDGVAVEVHHRTR